MPQEIYQDELRWIRFLEEGADYEKDWYPQYLKKDEAKTLHTFLVEQYGNEEYRGLLRELEAQYGIDAA